MSQISGALCALHSCIFASIFPAISVASAIIAFNSNAWTNAYAHFPIPFIPDSKMSFSLDSVSSFNGEIISYERFKTVLPPTQAQSIEQLIMIGYYTGVFLLVGSAFTMLSIALYSLAPSLTLRTTHFSYASSVRYLTIWCVLMSTLSHLIILIVWTRVAAGLSCTVALAWVSTPPFSPVADVNISTEYAAGFIYNAVAFVSVVLTLMIYVAKQRFQIGHNTNYDEIATIEQI